jgi:MYXO-CTERM domain-containing protein
MRALKLFLVLACLAAASPAYAHFVLMQPSSWARLDGGGNPQKSAPCGNEGTPIATGAVIEYKTGDTIPITIEETTFHPGHYRVSLAKDQASLPDDPDGAVVPGSMGCDTLAINSNPTLPLLADGLLAHTKAFGATNPQTAMVKLPAGMTCDPCVLQVVEFMSNHGAPCFYHHCSNIKITANGADAGIPGSGGGGDDAGVGGEPNTGGGCSASGGSSSALLGLMMAGGALRRRGRRRGR